MQKRYTLAKMEITGKKHLVNLYYLKKFVNNRTPKYYH